MSSHMHVAATIRANQELQVQEQQQDTCVAHHPSDAVAVFLVLPLTVVS
jgi:hypothetical protein